MPRPGPVPMTAPRVPASGPPAAAADRAGRPPSGATTPKPIGMVDHAIIVLSAKTRPWKRCGTFTWMIVVYTPLIRASANDMPKAPAPISHEARPQAR